jgi:N-carbamoylputrescine amidase
MTVVAAVQFAPTLLDAEKNVVVGTQLTFEAAGKGARVIVLPELCTSGYVLRGIREASSVAQEKDGWQTEAFAQVARTFGCHVVFGYVETCEGKLYNSAAVVGSAGLIANVRKKNKFGSDNLWASTSEQVSPVVVTEAGRLGVLICRDTMNKFHDSSPAYKVGQKFYNKGSVDTIALLTNWGQSYGYPDSSWVELCEETGANIIVSNRVGKERDMVYKGGSVVIDRTGNCQTFGSNFCTEAVVGGTIIL